MARDHRSAAIGLVKALEADYGGPSSGLRVVTAALEGLVALGDQAPVPSLNGLLKARSYSLKAGNVNRPRETSRLICRLLANTGAKAGDALKILGSSLSYSKGADVPELLKTFEKLGPEAAPALTTIMDLFFIDENWSDGARAIGVPDNIHFALRAIGNDSIAALEEAKIDAVEHTVSRIDVALEILRNPLSPAANRVAKVLENLAKPEVKDTPLEPAVRDSSPVPSRQPAARQVAGRQQVPEEQPDVPMPAEVAAKAKTAPAVAAVPVKSVLGNELGEVEWIADSGTGMLAVVNCEDGLRVLDLAELSISESIQIVPGQWPAAACRQI